MLQAQPLYVFGFIFFKYLNVKKWLTNGEASLFQLCFKDGLLNWKYLYLTYICGKPRKHLIIMYVMNIKCLSLYRKKEYNFGDVTIVPILPECVVSCLSRYFSRATYESKRLCW